MTAQPQRSDAEEMFPPRMWLPTGSLLEELDRQFDIQVPYHGDTQYLSLIEHQQILRTELAKQAEAIEGLREALRKAVLWGECLSMNPELDRSKINFTYLNESREALARWKGGEK